MLHLVIFEPQPFIAELLERHPEISTICHERSLDITSLRGHTGALVVVSGQFPFEELEHFIQQAQTLDARVVVAEIDENEDLIVPLLEAGAAGYVRQGASVEEFVATLCAILAGKPPFAPNIGTALVTRMHELLALQQQRHQEILVQNSPDLAALTLREREILLLIRNGASNQKIAELLTIELGTVKNHVHHILKKLKVTRREHAARYVDLLEQAN